MYDDIVTKVEEFVYLFIYLFIFCANVGKNTYEPTQESLTNTDFTSPELSAVVCCNRNI